MNFWLAATLSAGLGEHLFAPAAELRFDTAHSRISSEYVASRKYTDGGYILRGEAERRLGGVIVAARYVHRNGGPWTKRSGWIGLGYQGPNARVVLRRQLQTHSGLNDQWTMQFVVPTGRFESSTTGVLYRQPSRGPWASPGILTSLSFKLGRY